MHHAIRYEWGIEVERGIYACTKPHSRAIGPGMYIYIRVLHCNAKEVEIHVSCTIKPQ